MGAGRSLEAAYTLESSIPAGTLRLVADGIILEAVDVTFSIFVRRGDGTGNTGLATFEHHFEPLPDGGYRAQAYEETAAIDGIDVRTGDQLVFRYAAGDTDIAMAYVPNGDGALTGGRIPYIELPN